MSFPRGRGMPPRGRGMAPRGGRGGSYGGSQHAKGPGVMPEVNDVSVSFNRNEHGTVGEPVKVVANYFECPFIPENCVNFFKYRFDIKFFNQNETVVEEAKSDHTSSSSSDSGSLVHIDPNSPAEIALRKSSSEVVKKFLQTDKRFKTLEYCLDGLTFFCKEELDTQQEAVKVSIQGNSRARDFLVKIKPCSMDGLAIKNLVDYFDCLSSEFPPEFLLMFNSAFNTTLDKTFTRCKNKFFDMKLVEHGQKVDFIQGFTGSINFIEAGLAANIHLKTGMVFSTNEITLDQIFIKFVNISEGQVPPKQILDSFRKLIKGLTVFTRHTERHRRFMLNDFIEKFPSENVFEYQGKNTNMKDYFMVKYKIELKKLYPVITKGKYSTILPMELCFVTPEILATHTVNYPDVQRDLLSKSTHTPDSYFGKLDEFANKISAKNENFEKFGFKFVPKPISFDARVLPTPSILNRQKSDKYFNPSSIACAIFSFDKQFGLDQMKSFFEDLKHKATLKGIKVASNPVLQLVNVDSESALMILLNNIQTRLVNERKINLLICAIPKFSPVSMLYQRIKTFCETRKDEFIVTQCMDVAKVGRRLGPGYVENILHKMNTKCGGHNTSLAPNAFDSFQSFNVEKTIVVAIDLSPISFNQVTAPSQIITFVSSFGPGFKQMFSSIGKQRNCKVALLSNVMLNEHLQNYRSKLGFFPRSCIIYRTGLFSEFDFDSEQAALEETVQTCGILCPITFIHSTNVQSTRFALKTAQARGPKTTFNVPSGTVIDSHIVNPDKQCFYLNSHFSPLGTSRPNMYNICFDHNNISPDEIQRFTFALCFESPRMLDVLARPVVSRQAELLAIRGKAYNEVDPNHKAGNDESELDNNFININDSLKERNFYC